MEMSRGNQTWRELACAVEHEMLVATRLHWPSVLIQACRDNLWTECVLQLSATMALHTSRGAWVIRRAAAAGYHAVLQGASEQEPESQCCQSICDDGLQMSAVEQAAAMLECSQCSLWKPFEHSAEGSGLDDPQIPLGAADSQLVVVSAAMVLQGLLLMGLYFSLCPVRAYGLLWEKSPLVAVNHLEASFA
eukprot:CAMPEP_0119340134 /NCGR_PEP_ID=MMETSP1333-20130426/99722_1 /TAXON_ID=418940 /ORGANISM="Scyphosphaera apsteinii, Strain RCC1455" /LENGTH=190 /DNA_ID=CAMNT_0007351805 /DNA_START=195 /DNA_END=767 /DNA_ORIENTATION=+